MKINMEKLNELDSYKKLIKITKELKEERRANPEYWSNNKRKRNGLPLRRKEGPRKRSFYHRVMFDRKFFGLIEECMNDILGNKEIYPIDEYFNQFVDVKHIMTEDTQEFSYNYKITSYPRLGDKECITMIKMK